MTKVKGLFKVMLKAASAPEFRPVEVKIARVVLAAALAYLGVHYGEKA